MSEITKFRTKKQREFDKLYDELEVENKKLNESLDKKHRKIELGGKLSEKEIDEMFNEIKQRIKNSKKLDRAFENNNPEEAAKFKASEKEMFKKATEKYLEEEHGIKIIK